MYWASDPKVEDFERAISEYIGVKYAVTSNSGTSAIHAILLAYGIGMELVWLKKGIMSKVYFHLST